MSPKTRQLIFTNLLWFMGSLLMAMIVWFIASIEADPINQRRFLRIPIQIQVDEGMIITNTPPTTAQVFVRSQQSILDLLTDNDIILKVDLTEREAGTYTIPLDIDIARPASADTQPAQITVAIEPIVSLQKQVAIVEAAPPPTTYSYQISNRDVFQVQVSGASAAVNSVVRVIAELDLANQQSDFERVLNLTPVDVNNNEVPNVTVSPRIVTITVDMTQRDDVRLVSVRPDIRLDTLPEDYVFENVQYQPRTVIISGSPDKLAQLGDIVDTQAITLENQSNDFTVDVPIILLDSALIPLTESTIRVTISISERTTSLFLQNIPITIIGLPEGYTARANPELISVLLNGTVSQLEGIEIEDIQAVIDVNSLGAGTMDLSPAITIRQGQVNLPNRNITLLPASVNLSLTAPTPEVTETANPPEITPEASPTGE